MVWQVGQSGNPKGRPSKTQALSDLANRYTMDAVHTMVAIMNDTEAKHADRLTAARMILDRAVGTPVQAVEVSGGVGVTLVELLANLPGQGRPATIEHDAPPPKLVSGVSLLDAAQAAEELALEEGAAKDDSQAKDGEDEDDDSVTLTLRPANDDLSKDE